MEEIVLELISRDKDVHNLPKSAITNLMVRDKEFRIVVEADGDIVFGPVGKKELVRFDVFQIKGIKIKSSVEGMKKSYKLTLKGRNGDLLVVSDEFYDLKLIETLFVLLMEICKGVKLEVV